MHLEADTIRPSAARLGGGSSQGAAGEVGAAGTARNHAAQDLPPVVRVKADEDEGVERQVKAVYHVDEDKGEVLRGLIQKVHCDVRHVQ